MNKIHFRVWISSPKLHNAPFKALLSHNVHCIDLHADWQQAAAVSDQKSLHYDLI